MAATPHEETEIAPGVFKELGIDGMYHVTGRTYEIKDELRSHGGRWTPATKSWRFPKDTDFSFVNALFPPPIAHRVRRNLWRCCSKAVQRSTCVVSWDCPVHGYYDTGYTGD